MLCPRCQNEYRDGFRRCANCEVDLVDDTTPRNEHPTTRAWAPPEHQARWRSTAGLRTALFWLFLLVAVISLTLAGAHVHRSDVIDRISKQTATFSEAQHADDLVGMTTLAVLTLAIAAGVVFIVWQWRTAKNAEVLGRSGARYGPGWSIGGWFIPLASFWIPVVVMQDLWRSSDPESSPEDWRSARRSALVGWWWAASIVAGLTGRASGATDAASLSDLRSAENSAAFAAVMVAIAAILAMLVVRSITARQVALRETDYERAA